MQGFTKSTPFVMKCRPWLSCTVPWCCFVVVWNFVWILQKERFSAPLPFSHCLNVHNCVCLRVCIMWEMVNTRLRWRHLGVDPLFSAPLSFGKTSECSAFKHQCGFSQVSVCLFSSLCFKWMGSKNPNIRSSLPHLPLSFYQFSLSLSRYSSVLLVLI